MAEKLPVKNKKSDVARRKAKSAEGRLAREKFTKLKTDIIKKEKDNYKSIVILKTPDDWWQMYDHSAVIYAHDLAARLKLKRPRVNLDDDIHVRAEIGFVTFQSLDRFEKNMASLKIFKRWTSEDVKIYDLGYTMTKLDFEELLKREETKWEQANRLLVPKIVAPGLKVDLKNLAMRMREVSRKMEKTARGIYGRKMELMTGELMAEFLMTVNGVRKFEEYLELADQRLQEIKAWVAVISDLRLIDADQTMDLITLTGKVNRRLTAEKQKLQK